MSVKQNLVSVCVVAALLAGSGASHALGLEGGSWQEGNGTRNKFTRFIGGEVQRCSPRKGGRWQAVGSYEIDGDKLVLIGKKPGQRMEAMVVLEGEGTARTLLLDFSERQSKYVISTSEMCVT